MDNIECEIKRNGEYKVSEWAGGTTAELYIYPKSSSYENRDFAFRISKAVVEA